MVSASLPGLPLGRVYFHFRCDEVMPFYRSIEMYIDIVVKNKRINLASQRRYFSIYQWVSSEFKILVPFCACK